MKLLKNHTGHYLSLIAILVTGYFLAIVTPDRQFQFLIVAFTTFFYVGWGIFHHLIHHDLGAKIVVEYVLIGSLGLTLILFLLKGGLGF